jgi:hypothetical protein
MTGLGLEGLAAVTAGEISEGMATLDEATAAAVGGEMSLPIGMGATCCYLIFACERARDFDRAGQWCRRVQELCRQWRWVSMFATCRTHHASVLLSQGAWKEAEAELEAATRELEASRPGKVTDGIIRLAELRRRQGRLERDTRLHVNHLMTEANRPFRESGCETRPSVMACLYARRGSKSLRTGRLGADRRDGRPPARCRSRSPGAELRLRSMTTGASTRRTSGTSRTAAGRRTRGLRGRTTSPSDRSRAHARRGSVDGGDRLNAEGRTTPETTLRRQR